MNITRRGLECLGFRFDKKNQCMRTNRIPGRTFQIEYRPEYHRRWDVGHFDMVNGNNRSTIPQWMTPTSIEKLTDLIVYLSH